MLSQHAFVPVCTTVERVAQTWSMHSTRTSVAHHATMTAFVRLSFENGRSRILLTQFATRPDVHEVSTSRDVHEVITSR